MEAGYKYERNDDSSGMYWHDGVFCYLVCRKHCLSKDSRQADQGRADAGIQIERFGTI